MIELVCDKNRAFFRETEKLTSGSIGVTINFVFSPEWDGLLKTAVFDAGEAKIDVVLTSESCEVPPEVLACPGKQLSVGVFGELADKTLVIPTIYAEAGRIRPGASPSGISSAPPTPSWPEQVQAIALEAKEAADSVRSAADAGEFNGPAGKAGGFYTPAVTQPDANTIRMSFTPSKEDMPAVKDTDIKLPSGGSGSVAVDSTLTASGKAADAKATGDAIRSLSEEIVTTSESKVSAHNTGEDSHNDIRLLISGLTDRINALADSDDTTLDQLSEIVAYIKSNRGLIEAITTSKVGVADIVDNLTTNVANKPLSAAQGVALKALIDAISIPDKLPNPNALTFTGAVTGSYDGSAPLEVEIPSGGGGLTVTNTAAVGQTVKITAVDENGQPTEWEAVDFSSGGDAEKRVRHIATVSVTAGTTNYNVTVDSNGDPLNLESVYILTNNFWGNNGSYVQVSINGRELTRAYGVSGSPQALALEKMGELQKFTNIPKPSNVGISFGDYYNGKSAVTRVGIWSSGSAVDTTIEIYGVDA